MILQSQGRGHAGERGAGRCPRLPLCRSAPGLLGEKLGRWAFWLYNSGLVLWIVFNFFPIGWPQLDAVYEHGLAYARSQNFYNTTLFWQWMRMPGDIVFALGALFMAWDFIVKLRPMFPRFVARLIPGAQAVPEVIGGAQ
jgi:nitric oxide reductase subunit B